MTALHGTDSAVGDLGDRAVEWIRQRLASSPVGVIGDKPALDAALSGSIDDAGLGLDHAWQLFAEVVAPNNIGLDSERFLAFIPLSPSVASVWMDAIVSAANFSAESWLEGAGAVAAENQVIDMLCRAAGMPPGAAGCFMSGGSIGNLSALAVGRHRAGDRRRVAVADTAHASVDNALHLLGLDPLVVPTGPDCRLTGDALRAAIGDRRDVGIIVAAGGSTNAGVIDDLSGCADVAEELDAWFHVDGAYGLAAILLPELRDRFAGLERADSFIVDPHKWLFATAGSCALVYRHPQLARHGAHAARAVHRCAAHRRRCIQPVRSRLPAHSARQRSPDLVRPCAARHRRTPGSDPPRHRSRGGHGHRDRRRAADRTDHAARARRRAVPSRRLGRNGVEAMGHNRAGDGTAFVAPSTYKGEPVGRLVFMHPRTPDSIIDELMVSLSS